MKLSEFMKSEHDYLDRQWDAFLAEKDKKEAYKLFIIFFNLLKEHTYLESEVLGPIVNNYLRVGKDMGPLVMINRDHIKIDKLLQKLKDILDGNNNDDFNYVVTHFRRALTAHYAKEVELHYPLFDHLISKEDWDIISIKWVRSKID